MKKILLMIGMLCLSMGGWAQKDSSKVDDLRESLWQSFLSPPDSIRVGCYYYWVDRFVDPKGVKKDLEFMKENGITLAFLATDIRNRINMASASESDPHGKNHFQSRL